LNPWSLSLLFTVIKLSMSMRLGRVIQHARQVRGRTCVGRLTPLRDGDFGYLFGREPGLFPATALKKVAHYADVSF
jgi:hypothetical protein